MSNYLYPKELKKLKACIDCHLIKTLSQFQKDGCENCRFPKNELSEKITSKFKGMIAITDPKKSWAAKYLGKNSYKPGFYCLSIYEDDNYRREEYENEDDMEEE